MAKILIKKGNQADLHTLDVGEPAFCKDTHKLLIGSPDGNITIGTDPGQMTSTIQSGVFAIDSTSITISAPDFDAVNDVVFLYIGGLLQTRNIDYTVSGNAINKVNTDLPWYSEYVYDIVIFKHSPLVVGDYVLPISSYESRNTLDTNTTTVAIGIPQYNKGSDVLLVFKNGSKLLINEDFTVTNDSVIEATLTWNSGSVIDFVVIKSRAGLLDNYDGRVLLENSVAINALDESLQNTINTSNIIVDEITGDKYKWAVRNGVPFLKVIEVN
jgi:hypothetical protein